MLDIMVNFLLACVVCITFAILLGVLIVTTKPVYKWFERKKREMGL